MKTQDKTIRKALRILAARLRHNRTGLNSPTDVGLYLALQLGELDHEEFGCLFLDHQNRLIRDQRLFRGTLTATSVYPREVVREAMACNAAAAIYYHNHPSGGSAPSAADRQLTVALKSALALVDVRSLDHIIVGGVDAYSMAAHGEF